MRLFSEPESWLGLRSERTVAGEFAAPVSPARPVADRSPPRSWREVRSVMRRTLAVLLGR